MGGGQAQKDKSQWGDAHFGREEGKKKQARKRRIKTLEWLTGNPYSFLWDDWGISMGWEKKT